MLVASFISVTAICYAAQISATVWLLLSLYYTSSISRLTIRMQISDFSRYVLFALLANLPAFYITQTDWLCIVQLLVGGMFALGIYLGLLIFVKDSALQELYHHLQTTALGQRILPQIP